VYFDDTASMLPGSPAQFLPEKLVCVRNGPSTCAYSLGMRAAHAWMVHFAAARLTAGRRTRILTAIDDATGLFREGCIVVEVKSAKCDAACFHVRRRAIVFVLGGKSCTWRRGVVAHCTGENKDFGICWVGASLVCYILLLFSTMSNAHLCIYVTWCCVL